MNPLQKLVGLLACVLCIFVLGPMAFVINVMRVLRAWAQGLPADYLDLRGVTPMFLVWLSVVVVLATVFTRI